VITPVRSFLFSLRGLSLAFASTFGGRRILLPFAFRNSGALSFVTHLLSAVRGYAPFLIAVMTRFILMVVGKKRSVSFIIMFVFVLLPGWLLNILSSFNIDALTSKTVWKPCFVKLNPFLVSKYSDRSPFARVKIQVLSETRSPSLARLDTAKSTRAI
jgi:hypothetical protein